MVVDTCVVHISPDNDWPLDVLVSQPGIKTSYQIFIECLKVYVSRWATTDGEVRVGLQLMISECWHILDRVYDHRRRHRSISTNAS